MIIMRKSFKYRIYPTTEQVTRLENSLDLLREIYNAGLQERKDAWRLNHISISYFDQSKQVPEIRMLRPEFMQVQSRCLRQTLRQLDKSFKAFFRRVKAGEKAGFPRFKGKSFFNSIIYNGEGYRFRGNKLLNLSLIGDLKIKLARPFEGKIKEVVVKREGDKWFAILSCDGVPAKPLPATNQSIGVDVGIESFATLSDGTQIENPRFYEKTQKQLRIAQRRVARRTKGSNRRHKAVAMLRNIHYKIANQRRDFQHKVSTWLIQNHDNIAVEKLNIKGLVKGRLSKQIHDVGWGDFIFMLSYKAESAGRKLMQVNPAYTSQDCSRCKRREKKSLSVRQHHCSNCGLSLHRDHNAALNILSVGLTDLALT